MSEISENSEGNKRIAKNTFFLYIRLIFVLIISLYTSRVVLKTLGVEDYGIYNVVAGFVSMFAFLNSSLTSSAQRFYNFEKGKNGQEGLLKVFITTFYIQLFLAAFVLLITETVGLWYVTTIMVYPPDRATAVLVVYQASVIALLLVVLQIPFSAAIIAHERINYYAIVGVLDVMLKLIVALIVPYFGNDNLKIYGVLIGCIAIIDYLLYNLYCRKYFPYLKFRNVFYKETFIEMIKFSGWTAFNTLSQVFRHQGINLLINFFFGPIVNAAHSIAYRVKGALLGFVMNITTAAQPQVVESYAMGNFARTQQLMFTVSKFIFLSLYMVALPIMVETDYVLHLWLGEVVPEYTVIFTVLVLASTMFDILNTPITMVVNATGKISLYNFWISSLGLTVLPIAYFCLKNSFNPVSIYVISLLSSIVIQFVCMVIMQKITHFKIMNYIKNVLLPIMTVVMTTFLFPLLIEKNMDYGFFRFVLVIASSFIVVSLSGIIIGLNRGERDFVFAFIKKLYK